MGKNQLRNIGIDVIGTVPWSTHLCQFYDTKQDLLDILLPFFKTGLENNEFCIWITSEPLKEEEVKEAMRKAVPNFTRYLKSGQIEIVPYNKWYLKEGAFNGQRVLNAWIDKLNQALSKGYDGMRVTGDTAWLEEKDWRDFVNYEEEVDKVIGRYNMLTLCTYPLIKCGASEIIDVMGNHQFVLIKRAGDWVLGSSEYRHLRHDFEERGKELNCLYGVFYICEKPDITLHELYREIANLLPQGWQYPEITCAKITINSKEFRTANYRDTDWKQSSDIKVRAVKVGAVEVCYLEETPEFDEGPFLKEERQLIDTVAEQLGESTERMRAGKGREMTFRAMPRRNLTPLEEGFLQYGLKGFSGPEMIELLLCSGLPRKDCKKVVGMVVAKYKTLGEFLAAPAQELGKIPGVTPSSILFVKLMQEMPEVFLKEKIIGKPIYKSSQEIFDYLYHSMRDLEKEVLKVVYLDSQNKIIDTEDLFEGTLDGIYIYPREIEAGAIKHKATGLIFVHNHPSGDPEPSRNDKQITRDLVFIGMVLQIKVLDHIIIGENRYFSFADTGLIAKYEDDFLNLRLRRFVLQSS
ncbi:hypothetical protein ES707_09850 [subsurface metagenome]